MEQKSETKSETNTPFKPLPTYYPDNNKHHIGITFSDVAEELKTKYNFEESVTSTSLDILALYLKGQKILHIESKTLCEKRLNSLMLPAIFISSLCAILNFALQTTYYGVILVSCLNVINSFLMALISYLKLDGKAQSHQSSAYKYQKLESLCEFNSGRILFFKDTDDIIKIVDDIHNRVLEIKESNQFIIPEEIRHRFNEIFSTNIFTLVKDIQNEEIILINKLKDVTQDMKYLQFLRREEKTKIQEVRKLIEQLRVDEKNARINKTKFIEKYIKEEVEKEINYNEQINYKELAQKVDITNIQTVLEDDIRMINKRIQDMEEDIKQSEKNIIKYSEEKDNFAKERNIALEKAISHRKKYLTLSNTFDDEISNDRKLQKDIYDCCKWCKT